MSEDVSNSRIGIIGLGYVGLPLAIEFSKKYNVVGYDNDKARIAELLKGVDRTKEINLFDLNEKKSEEFGISFSNDSLDLVGCNIFIITVPTPVDQFKLPNLSYLIDASKTIGQILKVDDIVVYESTVYPGCTEEDCVPILEKHSGLRFNVDFFVGYSPERINPGDKINTLTKIQKVTSGSNIETAKKVNQLYLSIIKAGTYMASSIKVAEASKAIENAQRDLNISFMNELALIFDRMGIDTTDVLEAAGTKWNFLKYKPGLVGGHCIGVDPYYLTYKSQLLGYHPQVILSGRKVNDQMGIFVANKVVKLMLQKEQSLSDAKVLILGFTFKENCPDTRNTKIADIYHEIVGFGCNVDIVDPWADPMQVKMDFNIKIKEKIDFSVKYNALIVAVAHDAFLKLDYKSFKQKGTIIYDTKSLIPVGLFDARL